MVDAQSAELDRLREIAADAKQRADSAFESKKLVKSGRAQELRDLAEAKLLAIKTIEEGRKPRVKVTPPAPIKNVVLEIPAPPTALPSNKDGVAKWYLSGAAAVAGFAYLALRYGWFDFINF
jgi:hypothetical protein